MQHSSVVPRRFIRLGEQLTPLRWGTPIPCRWFVDVINFGLQFDLSNSTMTLNPYHLKARPDEALDLNEDHLIRWIERCWERHGRDLTQDQWDAARPTIVRMLRDCPEYWDLDEDYLSDPEAAIQALDCPVDPTGRNPYCRNLSRNETNHLFALRWTIRSFLRCNVLEPRIRRIVGAGLTLLIEPSVALGSPASTLGATVPVAEGMLPMGSSPVGATLIQFPSQEAQYILSQCMKSYRLIDGLHYWDADFFLYRGDSLYRIAEARNLLACFAMIDMQVTPWESKALEHLRTLGLHVDDMRLREHDTLSRADLRTPLTGLEGFDPNSHTDRCELHLRSITTTLPRAINNDDRTPAYVGFATVGGHELTRLAPHMFRVAQARKRGCPWQLVNGHYVSVWMTVQTSENGAFYPLSLTNALRTLQAARWCTPTTNPYHLSPNAMGYAWLRRNHQPPVFWDSADIPRINEDEAREDEA